MSNNKRGLGKGLGALIPQGTVFTGGRTIVNLEINKIHPNPRQPRTTFNEEMLDTLAASIKEQGVIEPILVRMREGKYELIAGERRLRASKKAGLTIIPAIIKEFSDEQSLELALIENLQREDLNAIDEAEGYARLISEFKYTQEQVAKKVSKDRSTIANMLRILSLQDKVKESLRKNEISFGHAKALLAMPDADKQVEVWKMIIINKLNVRDVEALSGQETQKSPEQQKKSHRKRAYTQNVELNNFCEKLTTHFGTRVKIFGSSERGKIDIEYYSREDLERILDLMLKDKKNEPSFDFLPPNWESPEQVQHLQQTQ